MISRQQGEPILGFSMLLPRLAWRGESIVLALVLSLHPVVERDGPRVCCDGILGKDT